MSPVTRRGWLQSTALFAGAPCACLAQASNDCCTVPEAPANIQPGLVTLDLARTPALQNTGGAVKIIDADRKLQILIARPTDRTFVALDQRCTHGGGALTYVHKHKHIYCTCWGHAKFALDGSVLRWPNKQTPKPLRVHPIVRRGNVLEIRVDGLA
uniref:Rieske (2Fe-2S) domain protein n=1 Tax=Solibacter usitatus (strain Ellin6076) TaxID=234267 RepID=Q02D18_SOLUE